MARKHNGIRTGQRDAIASSLAQPPPIVLLPRRPVQVTVPQFLKEVRQLDDRRRYHPLRTLSRITPLAALSRSATRIVPKSQTNLGQWTRSLPYRQRFAVPHKISLCVRRRIRKEVIHAIGFAKGGKGTRRSRKPRRNFWSDVSC